MSLLGEVDLVSWRPAQKISPTAAALRPVRVERTKGGRVAGILLTPRERRNI